jgi:hypothetical protein
VWPNWRRGNIAIVMVGAMNGWQRSTRRRIALWRTWDKPALAVAFRQSSVSASDGVGGLGTIAAGVLDPRINWASTSGQNLYLIVA